MIKKARNILKPPAKIGIVGGGQLGRMLTFEAKRMGYHVTVLDPNPDSPASQVADRQIVADYFDRFHIRKLAEATDVITYEFEHINAEELCRLEEDNYLVIPSGRVLRKIQNKHLQKTILKRAGLPVPDFWKVSSREEIEKIIDEIGLPLVLKSCFGGYDGKGNAVIRKRSEVQQAIDSLGCEHYYLEQYVNFVKELSIIVAANPSGEVVCYPLAENIHEDNILRLTRVPADVNESVEKEAEEIARKVMAALGDSGVFCVELFVDRLNNIYINEIAPRPHNSGHYTIEASVTSQYEQLVRILTGMPLGSTKLISPCVMANILGDNTPQESGYHLEGLDYALSYEGLYLHLYGKNMTSRLRKLGHFTVLSKSVAEADRIAGEVIERLKVVRE